MPIHVKEQVTVWVGLLPWRAKGVSALNIDVGGVSRDLRAQGSKSKVLRYPLFLGVFRMRMFQQPVYEEKMSNLGPKVKR